MHSVNVYEFLSMFSIYTILTFYYFPITFLIAITLLFSYVTKQFYIFHQYTETESIVCNINYYNTKGDFSIQLT